MNKKLTLLLFLFLLSCNVDSSTEFGIGSPEPFYGDMTEEMSTSRSESLSQGDYIVKTAYGSVDVEEVSKFSNININANDVTTYVLNIDSRLNSLLNEKADLEEIKAEAKTTSEKLEVQSQLRYINQDIEILEDQKNYYETSVSYSTLSLEIREGSGISLFSWNYYVQRALGWIEGLVGITISLSIVLVPLGILIIGYRRFKSNK
jgi:hypothetical protein